MTDSPTEQPADSGTTTPPRTSVQSAQDAEPQNAPTTSNVAPPEVQHTPTYQQGTVSTHAEAATSIPPGTEITIADPADPPVVTPAPGTLEIAQPAPLPRPGDENLTRGTVDGDAQIADLTGVAPEVPKDPNAEAPEQQ